MKHNYRPYIGIEYEGRHGCYRLVARMARDLDGVDLWGMDEGLADDPDARAARLHSCIAQHAEPVDEPREGDLVLIRSAPWHIARVIDPPWMIHTYLGGASVCERWDEPAWRNRVEGFYRVSETRRLHDGAACDMLT